MYKKLDLTKRVLKIYNPYQPINITALAKRRVLPPEIIDVRGNGGMPLFDTGKTENWPVLQTS